MSYTVVGLFPSNEMADAASNRLDEAGFSKEDYNSSRARSEGDFDAHDDYDEDEHTKGFWETLFGDNESEQRAYSYAGTKSNVVTVYTDDRDRAERAREIMDQAGATSVDDHLPESFYSANPGYKRNSYSSETTYNSNNAAGSSTNDAGYAASDSRAGTDYNGTHDNFNNDNKIEVVNEELNVGKKEVEDGALRVRSRIIERPVEENLRLKEERVYIKRNPVNRTVNTDDAFQDSTIEMTQSREVPVVNKTAKVVEEISLGKDVQEREHTVSDTVRETKLDSDKSTF